MKTEGRNKTIDIGKGICMFCVIWGHVIQKGLLDVGYEQNAIYKFIYSFHMPMLMLFSGYFFYSSLKKYSFQELLKRKIMQLVVPIFVWNTTYYVLDVLLYNAMDVGAFSVVGYIKYLFTGLWFLWAVLFYSIILSFIVKKIENKKHRLLLTVLSFFVLLISPNRWRLIFEYCFFLIGYNIKSCHIQMKESKISNAFILVGGAIILVVYSGWYSFLRMDISTFVVSVASRNISEIGRASLSLLFAFIISSIGCLTITVFSSTWTKILSESNWLLNAIQWIGRNSLQIYVLQRIVLELCFANILKVNDINMFTNTEIINGLLSFLISVVFTGIMWVLIKVFEKVHLDGIMFGRH